MLDKNHILVTSKGIQIQREILKDTISDYPSISKSMKNTFRIHKSRSPPNNRSLICSPTNFSSICLPRAGYFGPKPKQTLRPAPTPKEYNLYPNYLNKEATDNPPRHFCIYKPESVSKQKDISIEIPKGKYIHHSLYNLVKHTSLVENPSLHGLNRAAHGKEGGLTKKGEKAETLESWDLIDSIKKSILKVARKPQPIQVGMSDSVVDTNEASMLKSVSFSRHQSQEFSKARKSLVCLNNKEDRVVKLHTENQKAYDRMLERFGQETKKKLTKYQDNQDEVLSFVKKMDNSQEIAELKNQKLREDSRYSKRLKEYQKKRFERSWSKHLSSLDLTSDKKDKKEHEVKVRTKELKGGPLFNILKNGINQRRESKNSIISLKLKRRNSIMEDTDRYESQEGKEKNDKKSYSRLPTNILADQE